MSGSHVRPFGHCFMLAFPHVFLSFHCCSLKWQNCIAKHGSDDFCLWNGKTADFSIQVLKGLITARKRSLGQGYILTSVCQEFCSQGGLVLGGCLVQWGVPGLGGVPGPGGCLVQEGVWSRGVPGGDPPGRLLLRAVRILLECILVKNISWQHLVAHCLEIVMGIDFDHEGSLDMLCKYQVWQSIFAANALSSRLVTFPWQPDIWAVDWFHSVLTWCDVPWQPKITLMLYKVEVLTTSDKK